MIQGHGDDAYRYEHIRANFSSNIFSHADLSALKRHLAQRLDAVGAYPEPDAHSLAALIARKKGVGEDCVLVTNGATEAIYLVAQAAARAGWRRYWVRRPTFSEYDDASLMYGLEPADEPEPGAVAWLCNPNNPTGEALGADELPTGGLTVVDQSYEDLTLAPLTSAAEVVERDDTVQIHSLTKTYAVPGLRIGYTVASPRLTERLRRFQRPWSVNALAVEAGKWLVEHDARGVADLAAYLAEAQRLGQALGAVEGVSVSPTSTHFMLARIDCATAAELKYWLARHHGLLIRDAANFRGLSAHHFRVAAQWPEENDLLVAAIREFAEEKVTAPAAGGQTR